MRLLSLLVCLACTVTAYGQDIFTANNPGETPNRSYHVVHYNIDVTLHPAKKSLDGKVTTTLVPLLPALREVVFDAGDMTITKVSAGKANLKFESTKEKLTIDLGRPYSQKESLTLTVEYSCKESKGLTFNNTDLKIPNKRPQIWSQGEETTNHYWFPCYDYPNDKATVEVTGTVDSKFVFLSNGKLISVKEDKKNGTKTYHWKESKPMSSYLVMIAAGEYTVLRDNVGNLPLEFYAYPDDTANARASFRETAEMIKFFNRTTGVDYPWEKYAQIILQDHFGGMENVSATTLSDTWAVPDKRARIDNPSTSLIAHELAHQWFGDLVTCRNFRDMWLNESFASYYDPLFQRFWQGEEEFQYTMFEDQNAGIRVDTTRGRKPVVSVASYGENVYPRGAAILHMLHFVLGDDLYHRSILRYVNDHKFQPVETNDLKVAIEEETGQNLQWFFDEWLYKAGHPVFDVSYRWDEASKKVFLSAKQTQKMDSLTGVFRMPVDVEVTTGSGSTTHRIGILTADSTYALPSADKPLLVIFDKGDKLIKELHFDKTFEEWKYQALHATNLVDRLLAVREVSARQKEGDIAEILSDRIVRDPFWAVRREAAARATGLATKSDSLRVLFKPAFVAAAKDARSQVRVAASYALRLYRGSDVATVLRQALEDSSYSVMNSALISLTKADSANALPVVRKYLDYPSHQNTVATTALSALSSLDTVQALQLALQKVTDRRYNATRSVSFGIMRKFGRGNREVYEKLESCAAVKGDPFRPIAVMTLGEIGDQSVLPALESIASEKDDPTANTATASINQIKKRIEAKKE